MFHVIPVLKLLVHATISREWDIFKIVLFYTEEEKCSYKLLLKEKIHDLMQAFPLDMESHEIKCWQVNRDS